MLLRADDSKYESPEEAIPQWKRWRLHCRNHINSFDLISARPWLGVSSPLTLHPLLVVGTETKEFTGYSYGNPTSPIGPYLGQKWNFCSLKIYNPRTDYKSPEVKVHAARVWTATAWTVCRYIFIAASTNEKMNNKNWPTFRHQNGKLFAVGKNEPEAPFELLMLHILHFWAQTVNNEI